MQETAPILPGNFELRSARPSIEVAAREDDADHDVAVNPPAQVRQRLVIVRGRARLLMNGPPPQPQPPVPLVAAPPVNGELIDGSICQG